MYTKQQNKRFNRSLKSQTYDSNIKSLGSLIQIKNCNNLQPNHEQSKLNQNYMIEINGANILKRLSQIQTFVQLQKNQRYKEQEKLIKMIREMQCKHSAIIYNSQIRYCKSPPKPEIFFSSLQNNTTNTRPNGLKKVSSNTCLIQREKENIYEKSHQGYNYIQKDEDTNVNNFIKENPQKITQLITKKVQDSIGLWCKQDSTQKLQKLINQQLQNKLKTMEQIQYKLQRKVQSFETQVRQLNENCNNINNSFKENQFKLCAFKNQICRIQRQLEQTNKFLNEKMNQKYIQLRQNQQISNSQYSSKIQRILQIYEDFKKPFEQKLEQITEVLIHQSDQINKMQCFNNLNHNIYSNKIHEIFQFLNNKFEGLERQKQRLNIIEQQRLKDIENINLSIKNKNSQAQKQKEKKIIYTYIEDTISNKSQFFKTILSKQLIQNCQKIENQIIDTISRHIYKIQEYIKRNQQKQDIIVKNYLVQSGSSLLTYQNGNHSSAIQFLSKFNSRS